MHDAPSGLKTISVFLDETADGEGVGRQAAALAQAFNAHLVGIHGINGTPGEYAADGFALGRAATNGVILRHRQAEESQALAVGRHLAGLAALFGLSAEFRVIWSYDDRSAALRHALNCDLMVVGQRRPNGLPEAWTAERLVLESGVPVLIVPSGWTGSLSPAKVVVAWNASREARRAVADAMPLLRMATTVTMLTVKSGPGETRDDEGCDIADHLARHGIAVEKATIDAGGVSVGEAIAAHALATGAGLVVIGAYSRSRAAEIIFGGVTRTLLTQVPVPLFVSR